MTTQDELIDEHTFREAMSLVAAPIAVVTTTDGTGRRWGFTASAVTSVSMSPPLVLVGIGHTSSCHEALTSATEFVINVLGESDGEVARRFATKDVDRFAGTGLVTWPGTALPVLPSAVVALRCEVADVIVAGDHDLLIGRLCAVRFSEEAPDPLVWYRRGFHSRKEPEYSG
ncbi:flavin reductase family protein [Lentzea sp. NPDC051213]|uniref:flavin reductase family protein n=1 Tax=Lentzea sp. NPDC051213 TaxID=3364126 RepID=UPI00379A0ECD